MVHKLSKIKSLLIFLSIITCSASTVFAAPKKFQVFSGAEIAAIVNEEMISITDLKNRAKFFAIISGQQYSKKFFEKIAPQLLEAMIGESLQRQQAAFYKIKIGKEEIKNAIIQMEKMNNKDKGFLKDLFRKNKIPYDILEKMVAANVAWDIISREMFRTSLQVSKNEVSSYMSRLEANKDKPHLHLAEIFIAVDNPLHERKPRNKVNKILRQLQEGAHFALMAQQFSESPTKAQGGNIGWIAEDDIDPEMKNAVIKLRNNQFTQPLRTQDGYKIIYLIDRKETSPETAAQTIYTYKRINFPLSPFASDYKALEVFQQASSVAENATSCDMLVKLAKSAGDAQVKEVGGVSADNLPPPVLGVLQKLTPCKNDQKIQKCRTSGPMRSEIGVLLFMVCAKEKIPAGKIDPKQIENRIASMKLQKLMSREMRNLKRAAYIINKLDNEHLLLASAQ